MTALASGYSKSIVTTLINCIDVKTVKNNNIAGLSIISKAHFKNQKIPQICDVIQNGGFFLKLFLLILKLKVNNFLLGTI